MFVAEVLTTHLVELFISNCVLFRSFLSDLIPHVQELQLDADLFIPRCLFIFQTKFLIDISLRAESICS